MDEVEVVVAHSERATLRVGQVFVKIDADQARMDTEVEAMAMAPIPTPEVLWRKPRVLALAALRGAALGRLGEPSTASASAWAAAGAAVGMLHAAPLPPWSGVSLEEKAASLDSECAWLLAHEVLPADLVTRNRRVAERALRPWTPVFMHGDLQVAHVFVDDDHVTGVLDWSEAGRGDAMYDLASLTLGHPEHLDDVLYGYGATVDLEVIRGWWSLRSLTGPPQPAGHLRRLRSKDGDTVRSPLGDPHEDHLSLHRPADLRRRPGGPGRGRRVDTRRGGDVHGRHCGTGHHHGPRAPRRPARQGLGSR